MSTLSTRRCPNVDALRWALQPGRAEDAARRRIRPNVDALRWALQPDSYLGRYKRLAPLSQRRCPPMGTAANPDWNRIVDSFVSQRRCPPMGTAAARNAEARRATDPRRYFERASCRGFVSERASADLRASAPLSARHRALQHGVALTRALAVDFRRIRRRCSHTPLKATGRLAPYSCDRGPQGNHIMRSLA